MTKTTLIVTCEHGGMLIPKAWQHAVHIPKKVLASHRGWDPGALELTEELSKVGAAKVFTHSITRLLIELNRSVGHPKLFSEYSAHLDRAAKKQLIQDIYEPYRTQVTKAISGHYKKGDIIWHISVHTFTSQLDGVVRQAEVGLLYDPRRGSEKHFAMRWQRVLKDSLGADMRVRMNYPYRGTADGFVTALRKVFPHERYIGVELEVNQGLRDSTVKWRCVKNALRDTLELLERM